MDRTRMRQFWNARAREDAFYFVDTRQAYKAPDSERFWEAESLLDVVLDGLEAELGRGDTVVEIGCGVGRITRVLASRVERVLALDVSDEMLEQARRLNPALTNVSWILGDGVSLDGVDDSSADACVSLVVFQHLPDPGIALGYVREVGRILRPGGWAALQISNDPGVHVRRTPIRWRIRSAIGRAPRGQAHPAWLGSAVELPTLEAVAGQAGLGLERVTGEGTQYCQVLLRRAA